MARHAAPLQEPSERRVVGLSTDDDPAPAASQAPAGQASPAPAPSDALHASPETRIISVFSMQHLRALVTTMRPRQWVKNLFVAAPVLFSKHLFDAAHLWRAAAAFFLFCLLSGAVYIINDVVDM